ncbi:MAG: MarR family transcriptional regulator [Oscillospiraceae bacterium]|nr:MarR family transcriptional regulator [Oscillospiraceae bacterium]
MKIDKVAILVKKASLEFDKISNPLFLSHNLTAAQYKILKYLYMHQDETVKMVDLEKCYSLTHPTAIGLLDALEEKGFVTRVENPGDRRSKAISLTEMALSERETLEGIGALLESRLTQRLDEEERKQLVSLLQKLLGVGD